MAAWFGDPDRLNDAALEARDSLDRWGTVTADEFAAMTAEADYVAGDSDAAAGFYLIPRHCEREGCSFHSTSRAAYWSHRLDHEAQS